MPVNQENKLLIYLVIGLGFIGGFLYYSQVGGILVSELPLISETSSDIDKLESLTINFSVFKNPKIDSLVILGESPVLPGATGLKKDIFAPF